MLFTPILNNRKQDKEINKSPRIYNNLSTKAVKNQKCINPVCFQLNYLKESSNSKNKAKKDPTSQIKQEDHLFFYSKYTQPSFGDEGFTNENEEDPTFLSERISYECESNQSLGIRFDNEKNEKNSLVIEKNERSEYIESPRSSLYQEIEKNDNQTQTDEKGLLDMLNSLNENDIKIGIKFVSQLAQFMKSFK